MRTKRSVFAFLLLFVTLGGANCTSAPTLTPSELKSNPDLYDGKMVRVRGWLQIQFEDIGILDSKGRSQSCTSITGDFLKSARHYSGPAIVSGIFRKHILPPGVISNGTCDETGLEVSKISEHKP